MKPQGYKLKSQDFKINSGQVYINTDVTKKNPGIILIWANWCGHCHRFIPTFNELQKQLGPNFPLVSLEESDIDKQLSRDLNINGFPTIKFFDQSGKIIADYNKERDKASLLDHICKVYHHCIIYH